MDTPDECRAIDFDNKYLSLYGIDYDDDVWDEEMEMDEKEFEEEKRYRVNRTRRALGW